MWGGGGLCSVQGQVPIQANKDLGWSRDAGQAWPGPQEALPALTALRP